MIEKSKKYNRIGERLIQSDPDLFEVRSNEVKIAFLASDKEKITNHKIIFGECKKVSEQYRWCCPYDFMIIIYEPNIIGFSRKQLEILVKHELLHIGIDYDGDEPSFYVAPHDIEDFYAIINAHGMEWQRRDN